MTTLQSHWKICPLIWSHVWILFLFATFALGLWESIDRATFTFLNSSLSHSDGVRHFWAFANHHLADWVEDLFILAFFTFAILRAPPGRRKERTLQFLLTVFLIAFTILLVNRLICRDLLSLRRQSPTLVMDQAILLKDYIPWLSLKLTSNKSFPGDHGTTAILFALSYAYLVRGRLGVLALSYGAFLCVPRLIVGAHWLSDILVGSFSIALFFLSWFFFSPLAHKVSTFFRKKKTLVANDEKPF